MEDEYQIYAANRDSRHPLNQAYCINRGQGTDVSETDLSGSEISDRRERQSGVRTRLNSHQQAQIQRALLHQMQRSYNLNGGMSDSDISLDEKQKSKKRTMCYIVAGMLSILLIMLIILLATTAMVIFIFWKGFLEFPTPSSDQPIGPEQLVGYTTQVDALFDEVVYLHQSVNDTTREINALIVQLGDLYQIVDGGYTSNRGTNALKSQLNQLSATTRSNISLVKSKIDAISSNTSSLNNSISHLDGQLGTIQNDLISVQNQASSLQSSINDINNRLDSPVNLYRNCRQDTALCNITTLRDTRLFCSTTAILRDIEVSQKKLVMHMYTDKPIPYILQYA